MNRRCSLSAVLVSASCFFSFSSLAHHSLASFDVSTPLWLKGSVVRFDRINPHSLIFLDEKLPDGQVRRWAINGPSTVQLERKGLDAEFLKTGDVIEVCGFGLKSARSEPSLTAEVMQGTLLVMPDGKKRVWADYLEGLLKCAPNEQDSLVR
jgi:hypothetical protein